VTFFPQARKESPRSLPPCRRAICSVKASTRALHIFSTIARFAEQRTNQAYSIVFENHTIRHRLRYTRTYELLLVDSRIDKDSS
jgi:hypothetical protein